jgi:glucosylceramidase
MWDKRDRRGFMRQAAAGAAALAGVSGAPRAETGPSGLIKVRLTAGEKRYSEEPPLRWQSAPSNTSASIVLDPSKTYQDILGFGASFTDASCYLLDRLERPVRTRLFHELFDPSEMGFSVGRICMGASDYATHLYSYNEGEPDPEMRRFSIDHDRKYIIPMLRDVRAVNPGLFLLASPWSPPGWMKGNNSMLGGAMRRESLPAYSLYFLKFLQAYREAGVQVDAITSQNEVDAEQGGRMPACVWPQELEIEFISRHLGPLLEKHGVSTRIWLLDHNYDLWGRVLAQLEVPNVNRYVDGVAWHGYSGRPEMMSRVKQAYPDKQMYWTEGGPEYREPRYQTNWSRWARVFADILHNWCRCIIGWNLALDEKGRPNIGHFHCGGAITINSETREIVRSGQYWAFAHYSRAVRRGAVRIDSQGEVERVSHVAFANPDRGKVAVLTNSAAEKDIILRVGGQLSRVHLPADSVITLTWS